MNPIDVLRDDYRTALAFIDKCDGHMFHIKNWAIITTSAVVAFAFSKDKPSIILANLALIIAFLYVELIYKAFQDSVIEHTDNVAKRIDQYVKGVQPSVFMSEYEFGFGKHIKYSSYKTIIARMRDVAHLYIILFYVIIAVLSSAAYFLCLSVG